MVPGLQMFQTGFFFGPSISAVVVALLEIAWLFYDCADLSVFSAVLAPMTCRPVRSTIH